MAVGGRLRCNVRYRIWWSEVMCCDINCGMEHAVCSNAIWNVVQWWCGVEWCDVKGDVKTFSVVLSSVM